MIAQTRASNYPAMTDSSSLLVVSKLLGVIILVFANGFFVAAEFALVAIRRSRVEQLLAEGHQRAKSLQRAISQLDIYLAATQLGVTMSSLGLGWLGEPAIAALVEPAFHALPETWAIISAHSVSVIIAFTIITILHIVLGELAPKSLAIQKPEDTALLVVQPLELYLAIFRPAIRLLNSLGNLVLRWLGLQTSSSEELVHSPEELLLLITASREAGILGQAEETVVDRLFRLSEQRVSAYMTPRIDMVWLDIDDPIEKLQKEVMESVYSRFPVCQETVDNLLGFVGAKELLSASLGKSLSKQELVALLKKPLYIPDSLRALKALELFKNTGSHLAIVVNEYGSTDGLVTLNDLLEAIVGDIRTGNEPDEPQAIHCEDGSWLVDGKFPVEDFKDLFELRRLSEGEGVDYQTVGGFIFAQLGHIPSPSEEFDWDRLHFKVITMDGHRIDKVAVIPLDPAPDDVVYATED